MKEEQLYEEFFKKEEKKVDYKAIIFEYLLYWPFIVAFLLLSVIFAYVYLRYQAPVYSVTSSVMIKQGDKTNQQLQRLLLQCKILELCRWRIILIMRLR